MIINFFYLLTLFFLYNEIKYILSPIKMTEEVVEFLNKAKLNENKKWDDYDDHFKEICKSHIMKLLIIIWMFLGLFTTQWACFLLIIILNFFIIAPISKLFKYNMVYTFIHWTNSIVGFIFGIFIIVNHFHIHIDTTKIFLSFFS